MIKYLKTAKGELKIEKQTEEVVETTNQENNEVVETTTIEENKEEVDNHGNE